MSDKKISQLTELAATDVAPANDVLAVVDVSATETKKITAKGLVDGALNAGTANGVLYLNGSKVTTSGSDLVFDGTNLGVGGDTSGVVAGVTFSSKFCVKNEGSSAVAGFVHVNDTTASSGSGTFACRSRGTIASPTIVQNNDALWNMFVAGYDGTDLAQAAKISVEVDGTPGSDDMPGRLVISTTPDGTQAPVEALRINNAQVTTLAKNPVLTDGTANGVLYLNASKVTTSGSDVTYDGTTLDINGSVKATTITADYIYANNIVNVGSFTWDTNTSSPAAASSVGSRVITPIHAGMRRCVINDSGVVQYYLNPTNSAQKADGTASVLTGADGMVMVEIPKFYTRREVSGTFITWSVSPVELPGFTLHPAFTKNGSTVNFRYIGAYDACVFDVSASTYISGQNYDNNSGANGVGVDVTASTGDKLASVSGIFPMVGLQRPEFRTIAANRGTGWRQLDFTLWSAVQLLYLVEYQTFYSQNVLGAGNTATTYATTASDPTQAGNGGSEAGKSNALGNASTDTTSGASSASRGVAYMSYRGIENFYGNEWNWVDGVIVNPDGSVSADQGDWWFTNNSADFSDSVKTNMTQITAAAATGSDVWTTALVSADNFFVPAASSGGSSSTYITDQYFNSTATDRVVRVGGGANSGAAAGAFFVVANNVSSDRNRLIGGRLAF